MLFRSWAADEWGPERAEAGRRLPRVARHGRRARGTDTTSRSTHVGSLNRRAVLTSALFAAAELHHYKGRGLNRGGRSAFDQLDIVEAGFFRFIALATDGYDATIRGDEPPSPSICMITVDGEVSRMHRAGPPPGLPRRRVFSVRHRGEQYNHHLDGPQPRPMQSCQDCEK